MGEWKWYGDEYEDEYGEWDVDPDEEDAQIERREREYERWLDRM